MPGATRILMAVVLGFAVGLGIGPVSVFAINARDMLRSNEKWPAWSSGYLLALLFTSIPAGVNGALGAGVALRRGSLDWRPVTILPVVLHGVVGVGALVRRAAVVHRVSVVHTGVHRGHLVCGADRAADRPRVRRCWSPRGAGHA